MSEIIHKCEYCCDGTIATEQVENKYWLCEDCVIQYDQNGNVTGHCDLDCCVTGNCTQVC